VTVKALAGLALLLTAACTSTHHEPFAAPSTGSSSAPVYGGVSPPSRVSTGSSSAPVYDDQAEMMPLHGRPLTGATELRFLIPGRQGAVLLDVDRHTTTPITGLPRGRMIEYIVRVGHTAVLTASCENCGSQVYVVPPGSTAARRITDGAAVATVFGQERIWLRDQRGRRCTLGMAELTGRRVAAARPISCDVYPTTTTSAGLVAAAPGQDGSVPAGVILRGGDLRTVFRGPWVLGVIGARVLTQNPDGYGKPLRLTDIPTGNVRHIPPPQSPGELSDGVTSPNGRWIAIRFGNPAWPGPRQLLDLWLLDAKTLEWQHVPSMPTPVSLKETGIAWTDDNRLVLLGRFDRTPDIDINETKDVFAVWRPGDQDLSVRPVTLPADGSASFLLH
jgi:hypothetical protein